MDRNIMILNTLSYEKDRIKKSRLGYFCIDKESFSKTDKFVGFSEASAFRDDNKFFELIPEEFIGQVVVAHFEQKPNSRDLTKVYYELRSINLKGKVITFD